MFERAYEAAALCVDLAIAAGSPTARTYALGASGSLRHAAQLLANEGRLGGEMDRSGFRTLIVGSSELIGDTSGWDTALRCRTIDGREVRATALWAVADPEDGVWMRVDAALANLWCRGRVEVGSESLVFLDEPGREATPTPRSTVDLGRDLIASCGGDLDRRPALAMALEVSLVSGSWCHLATGQRWFADPSTARAIVRLLGGHPVIDAATSVRLAGVVDREALLIIEELGWRHVPTPSI
ncbi:hypothetical protein [Sphingomonas melonis]|uniref:Uncharacterized protein n=1 Tax=Sphingomonas melonis TaxID=152682 RepID=A0A7Y9K1R7_9SPHN|nr:hypothetical protein [Sphingomonas melonis]NYD89179.1 hypothetical protein [Sphingomonas melonis]